MGLLDGDLQQMFGGALAGILLDGRHYHSRQDFAGNGDVSRTVIETQSVKGFREITTDYMRSQGYSDKDVRLVILQTYSGRVVTPPVRGDEIRLDGESWIVGDIDEDPAHASWVIKAGRK